MHQQFQPSTSANVPANEHWRNTIRPSADNAAVSATRAKLRSPACLPYEEVLSHHTSAAAFASVT